VVEFASARSRRQQQQTVIIFCLIASLRTTVPVGVRRVSPVPRCFSLGSRFLSAYASFILAGDSFDDSCERTQTSAHTSSALTLGGHFGLLLVVFAVFGQKNTPGIARAPFAAPILI
jgi:hypothetical protein